MGLEGGAERGVHSHLWLLHTCSNSLLWRVSPCLFLTLWVVFCISLGQLLALRCYHLRQEFTGEHAAGLREQSLTNSWVLLPPCSMLHPQREAGGGSCPYPQITGHPRHEWTHTNTCLRCHLAKTGNATSQPGTPRRMCPASAWCTEHLWSQNCWK